MKPLMRSIILLACIPFKLANALIMALILSGLPMKSFSDNPGQRTEFITLGTKGGSISANRAQPSTLLRVNGNNYLIDAGNGVAQQLALVNVSPTEISRIFITHNHDDHNADWGTLMGLAWSMGRSDPITVHGPPGTNSMLAGFKQYFLPNVANRTFHEFKRPGIDDVFFAKEIEEGLIFENGDLKVYAMENCHIEFKDGEPGFGWQKSYALKFITDSLVIVFSGDTGTCQKKLATFSRDADYLIHEVVLPRNDKKDNKPSMQSSPVNHSTPSVVGDLATAAKVKNVVLHHLLPGTPSIPDKAYSDGLKKKYRGRVIVATDLQVFPSHEE